MFTYSSPPLPDQQAKQYDVNPSAPPRTQSKEGGRIEMTTTPKGLMHPNNHTTENLPMIEGGAPPTSFGGATVIPQICKGGSKELWNKRGIEIKRE